MPGANYMGGKKNAAKARSRDKTGRLQKDFFGRRKLNILSKGLGIPQQTAPNKQSHRATGWRPTIDLEHARKIIGSATSVSDRSPFQFRHREENLETASHLIITPTSRIAESRANPSANQTQNSKLLEQLDIYEPITTEAVMSRILATPDLAGLDSLDNDFSPVVGKRSLTPENRHQEPTTDESETLFRELDSPYSLVSLELQTSPLVDYSTEDSHIFYVLGDDDWSILGASPAITNKSYVPRPIKEKESSSLSLYSWESFSQRSPCAAAANRLSEIRKRSEVVEGGVMNSDPSQKQSTFLDEDEFSCSRKNILEYPDPWAQIGFILGLGYPQPRRSPDPHETTSLNIPELAKPGKIWDDDDLPPSDIFCQGSWDDMLFSESLPWADTSDTTVNPTTEHELSCFAATDTGINCASCDIDDGNEINLNTSGQTRVDLMDVSLHDDSRFLSEEEDGVGAGHTTDDVLPLIDKCIADSAIREAPEHNLCEVEPSSHRLSTPASETGFGGMDSPRKSLFLDLAGRSRTSGGEAKNLEADTACSVKEISSVLGDAHLKSNNGIFQGPCLLSDDSGVSDLDE